MRKYIFLVINLVGFLTFGQDNIGTTLPSLTYPHPTANSLLSFALNPVNAYTGIPDINIPLHGLKTYSDKVGMNISLSYHPDGVSLLNKVGDVGMGWNLNGLGSISKIVKNDPDFRNNPTIVSTSDDDVFVYNLMGETGRFRIEKDTSSNTYQLVHLTPTRLKIEFSMNNEASNPSGIRFDETNYFHIYDENGYKYVFDVFDLKVAIFYLSAQPLSAKAGSTNWVNPNDPSPRVSGIYRSTYHLKRIVDPNNQTIVELNYTPYTLPINTYSSSTLIETEYKITSINAFGHGKVEFDYTFLGNNPRRYIENQNSNFTLNAIEVKDFLNSRIKKYEFVYGNYTTAYNYYFYSQTTLNRRILTQIKEYNTTLTSFKSTFFEYNHPSKNPFDYKSCSSQMDFGRDRYGFLNIKNKDYSVSEDGNYPDDTLPYFAIDHPEPSTVTTGLLSKIIYPTGGCTLYEFESNTFGTELTGVTPPNSTYPYFDDFSSSMFYNPFNETLQDFHVVNYNTNISNTFSFTVNGTSEKSLLFNFNHNPYYSQANIDPNEPLFANCILTGPNQFSYNFETPFSEIGINNDYQCFGRRLDLPPGNYTMTMSVLAGETATGTITIKEKVPNLPQQEYFYGRGVRIKKIAAYTVSTPNDIALPNWDDYLGDYREYVYTDFNYPNRSSSVYNDCGDFIVQFGRTLENDLIFGGYSNVKVIHGKNQSNGFERLTYMKCDDFPITPSSGKEYRTLDAQLNNGLLKKQEVFSSTGEKKKEVNYIYNAAVDSNQYTFLSPAVINNSEYFYPNSNTTPQVLTTSESFTYNVSNKKVAESVLTSSDGSTLKKKYYYHTGNSIHTQNRISEIEKIETYRGANLLSTSLINYSTTFANNVSQLPSVVLTSKENGTLENRLRYVQYDEFSNPLQVQQEGGMPISYIWGYNKTVPVAKIENVAYSAIPSATITDIQNKSNLADNETNLITALNALRTAFPNAMITTYTYKPSIGISTVTDPKGDIVKYFYDDFNRLKEVRDRNNNLISENEYHYRPQN